MPKRAHLPVAVNGTHPHQYNFNGLSRGLLRAADGIATMAVGVAHRTLRRLKRTEVVRRYLYSLENSSEFSRIISHEIMLADRARVDSYKAAIDRQVRPDDVVLDLGTGTGILALMAARRGARVVHAIDQTEVIELARHVAESNGIRNVQFHRVHSRNFVPGEKVSLILHEQIGDFLIDEDMIANVCELRDRVLAPGGRILPARFEAFLEPVCLNEGRGAPLLWEQNIHGIDFGCTRPWLQGHPEFEIRSARSIQPGYVKDFLSDPAPAYQIDLETAAPDHVPGHIRFSREIVREGVFAGFAHYFRIDLGEGIYIENNPLDTERMLVVPHWSPVLYPARGVSVRPGDIVDVAWHIDSPTKHRSWKLEWQIKRDARTVAAWDGSEIQQ